MKWNSKGWVGLILPEELIQTIISLGKKNGLYYSVINTKKNRYIDIYSFNDESAETHILNVISESRGQLGILSDGAKKYCLSSIDIHTSIQATSIWITLPALRGNRLSATQVGAKLTEIDAACNNITDKTSLTELLIRELKKAAHIRMMFEKFPNYKLGIKASNGALLFMKAGGKLCDTFGSDNDIVVLAKYPIGL